MRPISPYLSMTSVRLLLLSKRYDSAADERTLLFGAASAVNCRDFNFSSFGSR